MNKRFILGIVAFILLVFFMQLRMPKQFSWDMTFRHDSTDPFGCKLFDSLMTVSLDKGYTVESKTFYQLAHDSAWKGKPRGVLMVCRHWDPDSVTICQMLDLVQQGNVVMIANNSLYSSRLLRDTLQLAHVSYSYTEFSPQNIRRRMENSIYHSYDTIYYVGHPEVYPRHFYPLYANLVESYFFSYEEDSIEMDCDTLAYMKEERTIWEHVDSVKRNIEELRASSANSTVEMDEEPPVDSVEIVYSDKKQIIIHNPIAISFNRGKGRLILVTAPLLFTNFSALNDTVSGLTNRLMSEFGDLPVVRTDKYAESTLDEARQSSPLRYLVSQPPLRWALYTGLVMLLLFMVFNSRRRQRVIPVVKPPSNRSLEFMKLVGTLYYERHDNADLLHTKYRSFVEEVRRKTGLDIDDDTDDEQLFELLAEKTGMEMAELRNFILRLRQIEAQEGSLRDEPMKHQINKMNKILYHL
ncbi:MAG: DUF4350 domain-containing protein [Prevotella sp.]|nr:DUF4350 domain-containing protein [Prevotella sp.]